MLAVMISGCTQKADVLPNEGFFSEKISSYESVSSENAVQITGNSKYEYETIELYAKRDENQIFGLLYLPQNVREKLPMVIFSRGFGGNYQVGEQYAKALAERGYAVYCFDFRGGSTNSRSDGSTLEMSIFTEQADLEAVIQTIREQPFVDEENIFLMGTSQGGAISAITAAANKEAIKGTVLLYPAFVLVDNTKKQFNNVEEIPKTYYLMWMTVGRAYAENCWTMIFIKRSRLMTRTF